ncbi:uncharacterized protein LOC112566167 [Pomacea canaliculata]|uniref:uncharacterized protein LOC112566167 n=1 Tax=Pomacea canaliculata TaxID=400727 RepID=UPI000D72A006|nr:uncharacterized protein LOC112566167 [Pomacea canaliculata]
MNSTANLTIRTETNLTMDSYIFYLSADRFISRQSRRVVEIVCYGGLTSLLCCVGVVVNVLSCLVFWRQGLKDHMNLCLFCLALTDCSYLLSTFTVLSLTELLRLCDEAIGEKFYVLAFTYVGSVLYGFRSASEWMEAVIAVERCVCVVFPLRASTILSPQNPVGTVCCQSDMTNHTIVPLEGATDQTTVAAPSLNGTGDVIGKQQLLETVVNTGVTSLICVVSVAGNVVNCLVFWRQGLKDRMNVEQRPTALPW